MIFMQEARVWKMRDEDLSHCVDWVLKNVEGIELGNLHVAQVPCTKSNKNTAKSKKSNRNI